MKACNYKSADDEDLDNKDYQNTFEQIKISPRFKFFSHGRAVSHKF